MEEVPQRENKHVMEFQPVSVVVSLMLDVMKEKCICRLR